MTAEPDAEAERLKAAYQRRAALGLDARYDYWEPANLFIYQSRERAFVSLLARERGLPLTGRRILDVGCGNGAVLADLLALGAEAADLHGVDLLEDRVEAARRRLPACRIEVGDARALPYEDASFDLVLGFTLLSSVVDAEARRAVASEMLRVLKPGGLIVLYDFRLNPTNRHVRPLKPEALTLLFARCRIQVWSVTLAPPVVRALVRLPGGWLACSALEMLPFLRTHFLAAIRAGE